MKRISDYIGSELIIFPKSIRKREVELRSGEELIAVMKHPKFFSTIAELNIGDNTYEFYNPKLFSSDTAVRKKGYYNPFAQFKANFWGAKGVLELPRGKRLNIKLGFKKLAEVYLDENDLLFSIVLTFMKKPRCVVMLEKKSEILDEYPWIIMLCFYLGQRRKQRTAAGG